MKNKKVIISFALAVFLSPCLACAWSLPYGYGLPSGYLSSIIYNIAYWILGILGIIGVIGFVISGIMYLLSAGNEGMIEKAKKAMVMSIVGVIVGIAGLVIIQAVDAALNAGFF